MTPKPHKGFGFRLSKGSSMGNLKKISLFALILAVILFIANWVRNEVSEY